MTELCPIPWIVCFRDTAIEVCKRARVLPQIVFESGQFSSILGMLAAGLDISIMPEMALEKRSDGGSVVIADEGASRPSACPR